MISTVLFGLLLISQLVVSQVEIIDPPSDVTACFGGQATFSCYVQFASETPSAASWFQGSGTNASSLPNHILFDNSSSSSTAPAIVNNTLLITNISFDVESGQTYYCQQGSEMSETATLTIVGPPTGTIVAGVPTLGSGNSNSIPLQLSYGNANSENENITGIKISWTDSTGNTMGSDTLNGSTNSYTIMGLSPSTQYTATLIAFNQCGDGPENVFNLLTDDGSGPTTPSTATDDSTTGSDSSTTDNTNGNNQTETTNPTDSPGAAVGMKCNITALLCLMAAIAMVMI